MDATFAALRDAFISCLQAGRCTLCGRPLDGEAVWIDDVYCADCARVHGDPRDPQAYCVWVPAARLLLATDVPDLDGGP
jgi:hypothetical protein